MAIIDAIIQLGETVLESFSQDHAETEKKLYDVITHSIETGESDCVIIEDPTRSLRITLDKVIDDISRKEEFVGNFISVKLHGNMHTSEDFAFRDITESICPECPEEMEVGGSFVDRVMLLLDSLKTGDKAKTLILIIEGFHYYCSDENQTLIYNLFDLVHRKAPVCLIGVSNKKCSLEKLDKRVFSRFSDKILPLNNCNDNDDDAFQRNINIFRTSLKLRDLSTNEKFRDDWNQNVDKLSADPVVRSAIKKLSATFEYENTFREILYYMLLRCNSDHKLLTKDDVTETIQSFLPVNVTKIFDDLSLAELALLIAICHHIEILEEPLFNVKVIYDRYRKVAEKSSSIPRMTQSRTEKIFESLFEFGLLQLVTEEFVHEYRLFKFTKTVEDVKDYVKNNSKIPSEMKRWMDNSLINE